MLAHVYPLRGDPLHRDHDDYEAAAYLHARDLLASAREEAGVQGELRWSPCTSPGQGLHELAESLGSNLLVVGSSVRGLLGRVLVGDDTRAALDGAPCAVAVAPVGYAKHANKIGRIGVGYDGSSESVRALDVARALAHELDASLAALEVVAYPACLFRAPDAGDNASVRELITDARGRVACIGDVEAHGAYGHAGRGARTLGRHGRPARGRLARLRARGTARARKHVSCARPGRALSRSCADALRFADVGAGRWARRSCPRADLIDWP